MQITIPRKRIFWLLGWLFVSVISKAQVPNDNIENRRVLIPEETVWSNTSGCTVQRSCVDESLTGKCVEYHNDQWFEFTPETAGDYFVNISGQTCRDTRGVQLVVFTGKPCAPETYQIISCTSLASQEDIFVPLQSLKPRQTYFLNVDGYLNDQCEFKITVSATPNGIPAITPPAIPAGSAVPSRSVMLRWVLPDSMPATYFRIYRREASAFKATEINRKPVMRDSYGKLLAAYSLTDTLPKPGQYLYQVVAYGAYPEMPVMISQEWRIFRNLANTPVWYRLPLDKYPDKAELLIIITDAANGRMLRNARVRKPRKDPEQANVLVNEWLAAGIKRIRVEIQQRSKGKTVSVSSQLVDLEKVHGF